MRARSEALTHRFLRRSSCVSRLTEWMDRGLPILVLRHAGAYVLVTSRSASKSAMGGLPSPVTRAWRGLGSLGQVFRKALRPEGPAPTRVGGDRDGGLGCLLVHRPHGVTHNTALTADRSQMRLRIT